jgi:hypothetical protein
LDSKKHKKTLLHIQQAAETYQQQQRNAFNIITATNKNLYAILEAIAEKEI